MMEIIKAINLAAAFFQELLSDLKILSFTERKTSNENAKKFLPEVMKVAEVIRKMNKEIEN